MNIRLAFILAVSIASLLSGCATRSDEAHLNSLMRHRSWPRIQQIATAEVKKRETLLGWPATASYLPQEHKDKIWIVVAMAGTPNGNVNRVVYLWIGDDGTVMDYKRNQDGAR